MYWLISELIPKKSEKFEFWKNFSTMFLSVKNWPKITKFWYLKLVKFSRNRWKTPKTSEWAKYPKKWEFSKNFFFIKISVKFCVHATLVSNFSTYESWAMKHVLFLEHFKYRVIFTIKPIHSHINGLQILRGFQICQSFDDTPTQSDDMHVLRFC